MCTECMHPVQPAYDMHVYHLNLNRCGGILLGFLGYLLYYMYIQRNIALVRVFSDCFCHYLISPGFESAFHILLTLDHQIVCG